MNYDLSKITTPCYLVDRGLLRKNCETLADVQNRTGCRILLALKGFAMWSVFDIVCEYLAGTAASSLHEARLGREEFGKEVHLTAPAYRDDEFDQLIANSDHIIFNSANQWQKFKPRIAAGSRALKCGLRINPMHSEVKTAIYDPCSPGSRLGITRDLFPADMLDGITGLHFHTLCELNADSLQRTLAAVEKQFGEFIPQMQWINFGGGHHITRPDYDIDLLCKLISDFQSKYDVQVYLEPGEAIALNTGFLIATVLDIVHNACDIAILDTSAAAHMPDVLEMPYRPQISGADEPGKKPHTYRLAGPTCLAGDVIGDYSFDAPLKPGDKLIFHDMAHYTMVKNTMFNGINLPDIVTYEPDTDDYKLQRRFTYQDFKTRLS
ncbi:Carboxynorspermidine/carboxyspermidine decarboxylase [Anaerohalosphaera lusitana]|uniref:Carboxynorspermidine/carboxyspermidine decarboxylase n=1 Tax=Anaerohalosphaera lusitana TaxID=1936003 RepID=A0A1U9NN29_9BACT|nr:carboxynorspermidine decarboxylase [Anaerohalosphaera lusitana]AQT69207.1 Carboxynorspermidine/carboxyspermidine decarboxylase [Anaerohalosphaera lusitana]